MFFLLILIVPYFLLSRDIENIAIIFSVLLLIDIYSNYKKQHKVSYIDIWNLGFLFVVTSEMILSSQIIYTHKYGLEAVRYICVSNVLFNLGHKLIIKRNYSIYVHNHERQTKPGDNKIMYFLLILSVLYFSMIIEKALVAYSIGRYNILGNTVDTDVSVIGLLMTGVSYFAPIAAAFYCRYRLNYKGKLILIIIILLCAIPQAMLGTRYLLLFTLVAPLIILFDRKKLSPKNFLSIIVLLGAIITITGFIKLNRDYEINPNRENQRFVKKIASLGSDEGVVKVANQIFQYTHDYDFHYGKESAFILYFWVPRSMWPEKPTQVSHWLINKYENVSEKHSAAYGFWGELFIDFGYFSLPLLFALGMGLAKLEKQKDFYLEKGSTVAILYESIFPVIFFSVRSPQTAIPNFILILFLYSVIYTMFKWVGWDKEKVKPI